MLDKIAATVAAQPAPVVRDSQYEYVEYVDKALTSNGQPLTAEQFRHLLATGKRVTTRVQVWEPVADLCRTGLERIEPPVMGSADQRFSAGGPGVKCPNIGGLNDPSYRLLQTLPTDPRALLNLIYKTERGHGPNPPQEAFVTIGDLLRNQIVPSQVSAALYRAAALIPGVTVVPDAVDATGRHGVAVAFDLRDAPGTREEWIFDTRTLQLLGRSTIADGKPTDQTAIIEQGFVDRIGHVPPALAHH